MDGTRLKKTRLEMGLTVSEFAKKYGGFSSATIRRWEAGCEMSDKSYIRIFKSVPILAQIQMVEKMIEGETCAELVQAWKRLLAMLHTKLKPEENMMKLAA